MNRPKRKESDLKEASEHLFYEIQMFRATALGLASGLFPQGPLHDAVLESFLIHVRNLLHFMYPERPKPSDVLATDYFQSPQEWLRLCGDLPPSLTNVKPRINKHVAQITYNRVGLAPEDKAWNYIDLLKQIDERIHAFQTAVSMNLLSPVWSK